MEVRSPLDAVPERLLARGGDVTAAFIEKDVTTLREAFEFIWQLPYGRNSMPENPIAPLAEGRGTCSTKHALLARLLAEQGVAAELRLGIYEMSEANTPGVGAVLAGSGLDHVPEAHCYLAFHGRRVDVSRRGGEGSEPIGHFLHEETIGPDDIGDYKRTMHHRFIDAWATTPGARGLSGDAIWAIREACIAALTQ